MTALDEHITLDTSPSSLLTAAATIAWAVAVVAVLCVPAAVWAVWSWAL